MFHWDLAGWTGNGDKNFLIHDLALLLVKWGRGIDIF